MAAFDQAKKECADGIELDIFLTADRKVVVTHDEDTRRLTGKKLKVRKSLYRQLKKLDLGGGEIMPLLDDVFGTFGKAFKVINVEIKSTGIWRDGIEAELALLIREHKLAKKILVSSFNPQNLSRFHKAMPEVAVAMLFSRMQVMQPWYQKKIELLKPDAINPEFGLLKNRKSPIYRPQKPLWVWNANTEKAWKICLENPQVVAVIVDEPDLCRAFMQTLCRES